MNENEFVKESIMGFSENTFIELKKQLLSERWLHFNFINYDDINKEIFAEKICDYFRCSILEIISIMTFDKAISFYIGELDSIVKERIAKAPKAKKKDSGVSEPRSRLYYDRVANIINKDISIDSLVDYTRILLCLYTSIINNDYQEIEDFDYSVFCLDIKKIVDSLLSKDTYLNKKKKLYDKKSKKDRLFVVMLIILFYCIKNNEIEEEEL